MRMRRQKGSCLAGLIRTIAIAVAAVDGRLSRKINSTHDDVLPRKRKRRGLKLMMRHHIPYSKPYAPESKSSLDKDARSWSHDGDYDARVV